MAKLKICRFQDIPDGEPFQAVVDGHDAFAVYKVGEDVYVTQDRCTHAESSLSKEGLLEGHQIICGWHDAIFDVRTGKGIAGPCDVALRSYPTSIRDGDVFIEL